MAAIFVEGSRGNVPFGLAVSEEMRFLYSANQKQELPMGAMFVEGSEQNEQSL